LLLAAAGGARAADDAAGGFDLGRPVITAFIDAAVAGGADRQRVRALLAAARPQPRITEIMARPAEKALQWWEYRARFITDERIDAGVALWREHRDELEAITRAERVEPQYVLAILGVETFYGRNTGSYRVLDALATLAFDYPPRATFFQSELTQFLKLSEEESLDATTVTGSYAGAMGLAQFMPSSYRQYAINAGSAPGRDLWNDWGDIFGSVAHYLAVHGWQYGGAVLANASLDGTAVPDLVDKISLTESLGSLRAAGFTIDSGAYADTPALALSAPQQSGPAWRVGFKNFYVITRYNRSPLYAMAVTDLADAIAARMWPATR
jgi:membrane-bound lytic murein transglycosylase B